MNRLGPNSLRMLLAGGLVLAAGGTLSLLVAEEPKPLPTNVGGEPAPLQAADDDSLVELLIPTAATMPAQKTTIRIRGVADEQPASVSAPQPQAVAEPAPLQPVPPPAPATPAPVAPVQPPVEPVEPAAGGEQPANPTGPKVQVIIPAGPRHGVLVPQTLRWIWRAEQALTPVPSQQPSRLQGLRGQQVRPVKSASTGDEALRANPDNESPIRQVADELLLDVQAAAFNGVEAGVTTADELNELWDPPKEVQSVLGIERRIYKMEPFERVEVDIQGGRVRAVMVNLQDAVPAKQLAADLELESVMAVVVTSLDGELIGQAYPERGVLFTFAPGNQDYLKPLVKQIVLEQIQPEPFVLRAEANLTRDYQQCLADIQEALKLAPDYTRAHWLHAQVMAATGDLPKALETVEMVLAQDPKNATYRLTYAEFLEFSGDRERAARELEQVVALADEEPLLKARALCRWGDYLATGANSDYAKALDLHQQALKLAQQLITGDHPPALQFAAQEVLIETYLSIAGDIAWGRWNGKAEAVPKWLDRAQVLIDSPSLPAPLRSHYRFRLGSRALWAYVGMQEPLPDEKWCLLVVEAGEELISGAPDENVQRQLAWQVGASLQDGLQVYLADGNFELARKYGEIAVAFLEEGWETQQEAPGATYLMGRAYFQLGSTYALEDGSYGQAVRWYDQALPLLDEPIPTVAIEDVGRQGETFVSMGVAYWKVGQKELATKVSEKGLKLMEVAAKEELIEAGALKVPYRNLANMHKALGNTAEAAKFKRLAGEDE